MPEKKKANGRFRLGERAKEMASRLLARQLEKLANELETEWREQRDQEAEQLYGAIIAILTQTKPSTATVIFVLEQVKAVVLQANFRVNLQTGSSVALSEQIPIPMTGAEQRGGSVEKSTSS